MPLAAPSWASNMVDTFLLFCKDPLFHDKWYTLDRLCELMSERLPLHRRIAFRGEHLMTAFAFPLYAFILEDNLLRPGVALSSPQPRCRKRSADNRYLPATFFLDKHIEHDNTTTWYVYVTEKGQRPTARLGMTAEVLEDGEKKPPATRKRKAKKPKFDGDTDGTTTDSQVPALALEPVHAEIRQVEENGTTAAATAAVEMPGVLNPEAAAAAAATTESNTAGSSTPTVAEPEKRPPRASETMANLSYWTSSNAAKMFRPVEGETAIMALQNQIAVLHYALKHGLGRVVEGGENVLAELSELRVRCVREHAMLLAMALSLARREAAANKVLRWVECCREAGEMGRMMGFAASTYHSTIMNCYKKFREKRLLPPTDLIICRSMKRADTVKPRVLPLSIEELYSL